MNRSIQKTLLATAIEASAFKAVSKRRHRFKRIRNAIRQLNFAAHTSRQVLQKIKDFRFENISADNRHARWSNLRIRLLNNAAHLRRLKIYIVNTYNAILIRSFRSNILNCNDRTSTLFFANSQQLGHARLFSIYQIVRENNPKRLRTNDWHCTKNSMTESQSLWLTNINALHTFRHDATNKLEKLILTLLFKLTFKFSIKVKMILNGTLVATGHKNHLGYAGSCSFSYGILNQRHVNNREHFLRHSLSGRKETRTHTINRENNFANGFHIEVIG